MLQPPDQEFCHIWQSPLGPLRLTANEHAVTSLAFLPDNADSQCNKAASPVLALAVAWLEYYFKNRACPPFEVPLAPKGTPFQKNVWQAVKEVKFGTVSSYGKIAARVNCRSARAVGNAISRNPVALLVPCHRVVMSNGKICGYAWGVPIKIQLLRHEGIAI